MATAHFSSESNRSVTSLTTSSSDVPLVSTYFHDLESSSKTTYCLEREQLLAACVASAQRVFEHVARVPCPPE